MCTVCGTDERHEAGMEPGRRRLLVGGASLMAAAPVLAAGLAQAQAQAQAPAAAEAVGDGPYTARAWAAQAADRFGEMPIERRALRPDDVLLDILYAGICHSDIHGVRGDWRPATYPFVPGHEIVGRVAAVGSAVAKFRVGDVAGVGCMVDSCGTCDNCLADREQICKNGTTFTYSSEDKISGGRTQGGYSTRMVVREKFALRIPPGMDLVSTAPILCAGITTFSPIRHWRVKPGQRVAVVGLGGLGHMALKLAVAERAAVTVFTTTPAKIEDARRMGAEAAYLWEDSGAFERLADSFDLVISTVPCGFEAQRFMDVLKLDSTLVNVGLGQAQNLQPHAMAFDRKSLAGSMIGGIAETQEVIDYCFQRNIRPEVQVIRPSEIANAYERVLNKEVRYRFVIDMAAA